MNTKTLRSLVLILLTITLVISACNSQKITLVDVEHRDYQHLTGYQISIPTQWHLEQETEQVASFVSQGKKIGLNILAQIGGYSYYSLADFQEKIISLIGKTVTDVTLIENISSRDTSILLHQILSGVNKNEEKVFFEIVMYNPMDAVNYYLIFSCGGEDMKSNQTLFTEVAKSFKLVKTADEIYSLLSKDKD